MEAPTVVAFHCCLQVSSPDVIPALLRDLKSAIGSPARHEVHQAPQPPSVLVVPHTLCSAVSTRAVLTLPNPVQRLFRNPRFQLLCFFGISLGQFTYLLVFFFDRDIREIAAAIGPPMFLLFGIVPTSQLKRGVLSGVLRQFQFWYVVVQFTINFATIFIMLYLSGVSPYVSVIGFLCLSLCAVAFAGTMDASALSPGKKALSLFRAIVSLLLPLICIRFSEIILHPEVHSALSQDIDFGLITITLRTLILSANSSVLLFIVKHFVGVFREREFVNLSFPAVSLPILPVNGGPIVAFFGVVVHEQDSLIVTLEGIVDLYTAVPHSAAVRHEVHAVPPVPCCIMVPQTLCAVVDTSPVFNIPLCLSSLTVRVIIVLLLVGIQLLDVVVLFLERDTRETVVWAVTPVFFVLSMTRLAQLRRGLFINCLRTFDFWYFTLQVVVFFGSLFLALSYSGIAVEAAWVGFALRIYFLITALGAIDAVPAPPRMKSAVFCLMNLYVVAMIACVRFAHEMAPRDVANGFYTTVDFGVIVTEPGGLVMSSLFTLFLFLTRNAITLANGTEFVNYTFALVTMKIPELQTDPPSPLFAPQMPGFHNPAGPDGHGEVSVEDLCDISVPELQTKQSGQKENLEQTS